LVVEARETEGSARLGPLRLLSRLAWRRPWLKGVGQLLPPLGAFLAVYVAALVALLITGFWTTDEFTNEVVRAWNLGNFHDLIHTPAWRTVTLRTVAIASAVTVTCAVLAVPYAYFMARIATPRLRVALLVASILPLWVSYLVRVYSWRLILNPDGALNWTLAKVGLPQQSILYSNTALWLVFTYIWFPFMVLPVYSALERVPGSYLEASADLGGRALTTFRRIVLPLAIPGIAAGSIFTFSLTLGDYIAPSLVGGTDSQLIGSTIYSNFQLNLPFAAAFSTVPLVIMAFYLVVMKRLGAFDNL
jgi:putative spermidine/putrescine transport system permease protein